MQTPGNEVIDLGKNFVHSVMVDEDYLVLTAHVDELTKSKIERGEYVDLAKLLPKDRVAQEDDQRLQMMVRNGQTFWVPMNENVAINNFTRWELAFRAYSDIYSRANPSRSCELIQYNYIIHTISTQFIWENVYSYDKDFHLHMARHPLRNWTIILQQAWTMRLKDRIRTSEFVPNGRLKAKANSHEICRRFNRVKCSYGFSCKYDHRCLYCFKFGHASLNCRKAIVDRKEKGGSGYERADKDRNNLDRNEKIHPFKKNN